MNRSRKFYIFITTCFVLIAIATLGLEIWSFLKITDSQSSLAEESYRSGKISEKESILSLLSANYNKFEKDATIVTTALPDQKDASKLISDLDALAKELGLKLTGIQSNNFDKKAGTSADKSLLQTVKGANGYELPLQLKVAGPYENFVTFVKRLENYQRLVNISSIEIAKSTEAEAAPDAINVTFTLTAYLKK